MTWTKLDDSFWSDPTIIAIGNEGAGAYARGLSYCGKHLTDGFIPTDIAKFCCDRKTRVLNALLQHDLWTPCERGYMVVGFLDFNPSRQEVEARRDGDKRRMALHRDKELVAAIRGRDGDMCRYCAQIVDWTDRRGTKGGTYDHIDPDGVNSVENLVVSCRGCNSRKGARTPDQASMVLLPIRSGSNRD